MQTWKFKSHVMPKASVILLNTKAINMESLLAAGRPTGF